MSTMYVTYLTIYTGNKLPMFYIGSSTENKILNGYHGSVSSKEYKNIWKNELKNNPNLFKTKIITKHNSDKESRLKELFFQEKLKVISSNLYINKSYARPNGFFGMDTSGEKHPRFKMKNSEQHCKKISESTQGRIPWNKGKINIYSKETKKSMGKNKIGKSPWNKGKIGIYDQKTLERIERSKNWIVISPVGEKQHIKNLAKFCRENNLTKTHMCRVAKGYAKHHKNWKCYKLV